MAVPRLLWLVRKLNLEKEIKTGSIVWGTLDTWIIKKMNGNTFDGIYKTEITNATCSGLVIKNDSF